MGRCLDGSVVGVDVAVRNDVGCRREQHRHSDRQEVGVASRQGACPGGIQGRQARERLRRVDDVFEDNVLGGVRSQVFDLNRPSDRGAVFADNAGLLDRDVCDVDPDRNGVRGLLLIPAHRDVIDQLVVARDGVELQLHLDRKRAPCIHHHI